MAQGGSRLTLLLHNGVHVHGHFIPLSLGLIDHPIAAGCVGELSNDKYSMMVPTLPVLACASVGIVRTSQRVPILIDAASFTSMGKSEKALVAPSRRPGADRSSDRSQITLFLTGGEVYERAVVDLTLETGRPCFPREKQGLHC